MNIFVIRHGLREDQENKNYKDSEAYRARPTDPPLSKTGFQQAEQLVSFFSDLKVDVILSSPMRRAIETVRPLAMKKNLKVNVEYGLYEFTENTPKWEEKNLPLSMDALKKMFPMINSQYKPFIQLDRYKKPENVKTMKDRVEELLEYVKEKYNGKSVVLASHASPSLASSELLLGVKHYKKENPCKIRMGTCSVSHFMSDPQAKYGFKRVANGETSFLDTGHWDFTMFKGEIIID